MLPLQAGSSLENHRCCCGNSGPPAPCSRRRPWAHRRACRDAGRRWQQSRPTCASGAPSGTLARSSDDLSISNGASHPDALVLRDRLAARRFRDGPAADRISQTVQAQDALFEAANLTSCFKALAKEAAEHLDGNSNSHGGMPAAQQMEFLAELCEQVQGCLPAFRPAQLVGILWACGRLGHHPGALLAEMAEQLCEAVDELEAKQLSLVAWALAKLEAREEPYVATSKLLDATAAASIALAADFHAQGLANICWSFGRLRHPCGTLLQALAPHAAASIWDFNAQGIANLCYGFAVLQQPLGPELSSAIVDAFRKRLANFSPQGLSMAIWSLSSLDCEVDESLLLALTDRIVAMSSDTTFNSIDICNILVAFGRLGYRDEASLHVLCNQALQIHSFGRLEAVGTLWSLGTLQWHSKPLLMMLAAAAECHAGDLEPREVSNVLSAFSRLQFTPDSQRLLPSLLDRSMACTADMSSQHLANVASAIARHPALQQHPQAIKLAKAIRKEACGRMHEFQVMEAVNLLWALSQLGLADQGLCDACVAAACARAASLNLHDLATLCLSLTKAKYSSRDAEYTALLRHAAEQVEVHARSASVRLLTTILWSLARLVPGAHALTPQTSAALIDRASEFNGQDIVFATFACCRLRRLDGELPLVLASEIESRAYAEMKPKELSDSVKSLSLQGRLTPALRQRLRSVLQEKPSRFEKWQRAVIKNALKKDNQA